MASLRGGRIFGGNVFIHEVDEGVSTTLDVDCGTSYIAGMSEVPENVPVEPAAAPVEEVRELTADAMPLPQVLEAILFSTDVPLSAGKLAEIVGLDSTKPIKQTIEQLNAGYEQRQ